MTDCHNCLLLCCIFIEEEQFYRNVQSCSKQNKTQTYFSLLSSLLVTLMSYIFFLSTVDQRFPLTLWVRITARGFIDK